ncbi:MAG: DUF4115 domain-containing protein [Chlamydiota bacterium]|nr:DUF4115 domain-containing protein [Chlamydiota bacterium]
MLTLSGKSKEDVWLRVHADGGLVFEGILKKGNKETWLAKVDFKIRIGNQDAIVFKLNGKDLGPLGEPGKVLEVRLTKEGKWINDRSQ